MTIDQLLAELEAMLAARREREMGDYKLVPGTPAAWRASDDFPDSLPNTWSRGVVAVTNFGRVCSLSCMGAYWQRPADFAEGEEVVAWTDFPDLERAPDAPATQGAQP